MNPKQILKRVQEQADARMGETVERLLYTLRMQHTHECWRKECFCDYCRFINGDYVQNKLYLHRLKKRINYYDYISSLTDGETSVMVSLENSVLDQKIKIQNLKEQKKNLQKNVL